MVKGYASWLLVLIVSAVDLPLLYPLSEPACMLGPSPLQMALKCSDLGHLCAPRDVHIQWVNRLEEEVRCQLGGDQVQIHMREKSIGNMQVDKERRFQGRHECWWLDGLALHVPPLPHSHSSALLRLPRRPFGLRSSSVRVTWRRPKG